MVTPNKPDWSMEGRAGIRGTSEPEACPVSATASDREVGTVTRRTVRNSSAAHSERTEQSFRCDSIEA